MEKYFCNSSQLENLLPAKYLPQWGTQMWKYSCGSKKKGGADFYGNVTGRTAGTE